MSTEIIELEARLEKICITLEAVYNLTLQVILHLQVRMAPDSISNALSLLQLAALDLKVEVEAIQALMNSLFDGEIEAK